LFRCTSSAISIAPLKKKFAAVPATDHLGKTCLDRPGLLAKPHMARVRQIVRLLALLQAMASSSQGVVLSQLAVRRGWPLRALYRDLRVLADAGILIGHAHGRYWLIDADPASDCCVVVPLSASTGELL
jgi:hypothetical protein